MIIEAILSDIALGVASEFVADFLKTTGNSMLSRIKTPAERKALEQAVAEALTIALSKYKLDGVHRNHYHSLFSSFLSRQPVLERLAPLLDPRPGATLDTAGLEVEFEAAGYDRSYLPDFRLDEFLSNFLGAFYLTASGKPDLRGMIQLQLLGKVLIFQQKGNRHTTSALEEIADDLRNLATLVRDRLGLPPDWPVLRQRWAKTEEIVRARIHNTDLESREHLTNTTLNTLWSQIVSAPLWHELIAKLILDLKASDPPGPLCLQMVNKLTALDTNANYFTLLEKLRRAIPPRVDEEIGFAITRLERETGIYEEIPEHLAPSNPKIRLLKVRRGFRARLRALRDAIEKPLFRRCLLIYGSAGSGKTHLTAFLEPNIYRPTMQNSESRNSPEPEDNSSEWRCLFLWLEHSQSHSNLIEEILEGIRLMSNYTWRSLEEFDRYLETSLDDTSTGAPKFVIILDDIQRRIWHRPDFLKELERAIGGTTQFHSFLWVISIQDTAFDRVASAHQEIFWQRFSFTPGGPTYPRKNRMKNLPPGTPYNEFITVSSWLVLDELNRNEELGIQIILREIEPDSREDHLAIMLSDPGEEVTQTILNPQIAWILLDSRDDLPLETLINLNFIGFIERFWLRRRARLGALDLSDTEIDQVTRLIANTMVERAQANPDKLTLIQSVLEKAKELTGGMDLARQVSRGIEILVSAGLMEIEPFEGGPLQVGERISIRVPFFWCFQLAQQLFLQFPPGPSIELVRWFNRLTDQELAEGTLEFLLLLSDDHLRDEPRLLPDVIALWRQVMEAPSLPQSSLWLAGAKGSSWAKGLAFRFAEGTGTRKGDSRALFTFLYFLGEIDIRTAPAPRRAALLKGLYSTITTTGYTRYCAFVLQRFYRALSDSPDWIHTSLELSGCEELGVTEDIARAAATSAFRLCDKSAAAMIELLISYLREEERNAENQPIIKPWKRHYLREWILLSVFDLISENYELDNKDAKDLFSTLENLNWYKPERLGISRRIGKEMEQEANIALGRFYRIRSDSEARKRYQQLVEKLASSNSTSERALAFFLIRHTEPIDEQGVAPLASRFHKILADLYVDPRLSWLSQRFANDFQINLDDFPSLEKERRRRAQQENGNSRQRNRSDSRHRHRMSDKKSNRKGRPSRKRRGRKG